MTSNKLALPTRVHKNAMSISQKNAAAMLIIVAGIVYFSIASVVILSNFSFQDLISVQLYPCTFSAQNKQILLIMSICHLFNVLSELSRMMSWSFGSIYWFECQENVVEFRSPGLSRTIPACAPSAVTATCCAIVSLGFLDSNTALYSAFG